MIVLDGIELRRGARVLLSEASVTLHPGEKIGLVGRNGAGKSSLFALFAGRLHEDKGSFSIPAQWQRAEVEQHMPETDQGATDFVLAGDQRLTDAQTQLSLAEQSGDGEQIAHAHAVLQRTRDLAHNNGVAVVAVLHDLGLAWRYADRVLVLRNGSVAGLGTPHTVFTPALLSEVFAVEAAIHDGYLVVHGPVAA